MGSILDLPEGLVTDHQLKDFITTHRDEHKSLNEDFKPLELKIKNLVTIEAMRGGNKQPWSGTPVSLSALKLPRIQIPRFEDNAPGSISWENFKQMMTKLTSEVAYEEKIFALKSPLTGESAKLVASEESQRSCNEYVILGVW